MNLNGIENFSRCTSSVYQGGNFQFWAIPELIYFIFGVWWLSYFCQVSIEISQVRGILQDVLFMDDGGNSARILFLALGFPFGPWVSLFVLTDFWALKLILLPLSLFAVNFSGFCLLNLDSVSLSNLCFFFFSK